MHLHTAQPSCAFCLVHAFVHHIFVSFRNHVCPWIPFASTLPNQHAFCLLSSSLYRHIVHIFAFHPCQLFQTSILDTYNMVCKTLVYHDIISFLQFIPHSFRSSTHQISDFSSFVHFIIPIPIHETTLLINTSHAPAQSTQRHQWTSVQLAVTRLPGSRRCHNISSSKVSGVASFVHRGH